MKEMKNLVNRRKRDGKRGESKESSTKKILNSYRKTLE